MGPIRIGAGSRKRRTAAQRLIDEAFGAYELWREECSEVARAYARWTRSPRAARAGSRSDYLVALEREEQAARMYERALSRLRLEPRSRTT